MDNLANPPNMRYHEEEVLRVGGYYHMVYPGVTQITLIADRLYAFPLFITSS